MSDPNQENAAAARARRGRNVAIAVALFVFVAIVFAITIVKLTPMAPTDPSRRNARVALICAGVFVFMVVGFAAVPLITGSAR